MEKLISQFFEIENAHRISVYAEHGGYETAKKVLKDLKPDQVREEVKKSNLRGLGGAGFLAAMKWGFVPQNTGKPIFLVVNADEGEPGTFKDRYILSKAPHLMLEGMLICAYAVGIHKAYIYIRGEYEEPCDILTRAIREAEEKRFLGKNIFGGKFDLEVVVHRGAGAYICGEETGLLESLEGKKGYPRLKPPFPASIGLFGCPTVIHNVETLSYLPFILKQGGAWFAGLSGRTTGGLRLFSVSGHVENPGVYERSAGMILRELIEAAGGMREGRKLKAVIPGGLSAAVVTADEINVGMDFDSLRQAGSMAGSAGVIVMDETACMVEAAFSAIRFFAHESCGQCSPCREGTGWVERILKRILNGNGRPDDIDNLIDIANYMGGTTICALADGAQMALLSYLKKFRREFEYHVRKKTCDVKMLVGASPRGRSL